MKMTGDTSASRERFLVVLEQREGVIAPSSLEVWYKALELAAVLEGATVTGVLVGEGDTMPLTDQASVDALLCHVTGSELRNYAPALHAQLIAATARQHGITSIFVAATARGSDLAARLSLLLNAAVLADCTVLSANSGVLESKRSLYSGAILGTQYSCRDIAIYTLRPHCFPYRVVRLTGQLKSVPVPVPSFSEELLNPVVTEIMLQRGVRDISESDIIVAGGRGVGCADNFHMLEELAVLLGGTVGASRSAVDAGWRPHGEQIGQTGKTVAPRIYIACGISGAIQHLAGIADAGIVVAINTDRQAPIFEVADYGIVGDVNDVLPALIKDIREF